MAVLTRRKPLCQPWMNGKFFSDKIVRFCDVFFAFFLFILFIPFFLLVAVFIKLDATGRIFFNQERMGMNGKVFKMYKFRTMVHNAHRVEPKFRTNRKGAIEPVIKARKDMRVTRSGKYLRKYSIDEFPQLINVLKGEMSLVGPRPPVLKEASRYNQYQKTRLRCKPGLTGLAQINGRTDIDFDSIMRYDIFFIRNRSICLYLKVLVRTIPCILRGKSSY